MDRLVKEKENKFQQMQQRWIQQFADARSELIGDAAAAADSQQQAATDCKRSGPDRVDGTSGQTQPSGCGVLSSPTDFLLLQLEAAISSDTPFVARSHSGESHEAACRRIATPKPLLHPAEGSLRAAVFASVPVGRLQDQRGDIADLLRRHGKTDDDDQHADLPSAMARTDPDAPAGEEEKQPLVSAHAPSFADSEGISPLSRFEHICAPAADGPGIDSGAPGLAAWPRAPSRRRDVYLSTWWSNFLCPWFGAHVQPRMSLEGFLCYSLVERAHAAGDALGELRVQADTLHDAFHFWMTASVLQPIPVTRSVEGGEAHSPSASRPAGMPSAGAAQTQSQSQAAPLPEPLMHMSLHRVLLRARLDESLCAMSVSSRHRMALAKHFFARRAQVLPLGPHSAAGKPAPLTFPTFLRRWLLLHHLHGVVLRGDQTASTAPSAEPSAYERPSRSAAAGPSAQMARSRSAASFSLNDAQIGLLHAYGAMQRGLLRCSSLSLHSNQLVAQTDSETELADNDEWANQDNEDDGESDSASSRAVTPLGVKDLLSKSQPQLFPALTPVERAMLWFGGMLILPLTWPSLQRWVLLRWQRSGMRRWFWSKPRLLRLLGAGAGSSPMEIADTSDVSGRPWLLSLLLPVAHIFYMLLAHSCWLLMLAQIIRHGTDTYVFRSTRVPYFFFLLVSVAVAIYAAYAAYVPLPTRRVRLLHRVPVDGRCESDRPVGARLPNLASVVYHLELQNTAEWLDAELAYQLDQWHGIDRLARTDAAGESLWPHVDPYCASTRTHSPPASRPSPLARDASQVPLPIAVIEIAILAWLCLFTWPELVVRSDQRDGALANLVNTTSIADYYNSTSRTFAPLPADPCTPPWMGQQVACPAFACVVDYYQLTAKCQPPELLFWADWGAIGLMVIVCCICGWLGPKMLWAKSSLLLDQLKRFNALAEPLHPLSVALSLPLHKPCNLHAWLLLREYYKDILRFECAIQDRIFAPQMLLWLASCAVIICATLFKATRSMIYFVMPLTFFMSITMLVALYSVYSVNREFEEAAHMLQRAKWQQQEKEAQVQGLQMKAHTIKIKVDSAEAEAEPEAASIPPLTASLDAAILQLQYETARGDDGYKVFGVVITANVMKGLIVQAVVAGVLALGEQLFD